MGGIVAYGTYVPYWRLDRMQIAAALQVPAGRGTRSVASFDEDTTTMGVEAGRACLAAAPEALVPGMVGFATADPAYLDKTNATAVAAALGLPRDTWAFDMGGAVRSGMAANAFADLGPATFLAVTSDLRTGLPGGADESGGGDGAAAFLWSKQGSPLAEVVGSGVASEEFLDRWRTPGESASKMWEERFGEAVYVPLAEEAFGAAVKKAGLTPDQIDHAIVTGVHPRAARVAARSLGVRPDALADDLTSAIGNTGTAHPWIVLADVLDRAEPNRVIALTVLADGAMTVLLRTTDALPAWRDARPARAAVRAQVAAGRSDLSYPQFLTWRGQLHREPPRRPDPIAPAAPPSYRHESWKYGFNASRCTSCGTRHLPPAPVCVECGAVEQMAGERLADTPATVATYTVDRLAFTPNPPMVAAVIDFDGGGRFRCEVTDVDPAAIAIGTRVEMTFRRISTVNGIHNYFWKARPIAGEGGAS